MTTEEVLDSVKTMPVSEWLKIQTGIAELLASRLSAEETAEIRAALAESEAEFTRGEAISSDEMRRHFGLR